jgi:hypothetical protein
VLVEHTTALNSGPYSVSETASHEILEPICNSMLAVWKPHPTRPGVEVAYENCDPCQDTYPIRASGTDWLVSNFVTPFWFMSQYRNPQAVLTLERAEDYGLDWCMRLKAPGEIGPDGYAVLRERRPDGGWRQWAQGADGPLSQHSRQLARKQHHASRTRRLLGHRG